MKFQVLLASVDGTAINLSIDRTIIERLVRQLEVAFDERLTQAQRSDPYRHNDLVPVWLRAQACSQDAVLSELLLNRACLRHLLGEDLNVRILIDSDSGSFEVDARGEVVSTQPLPSAPRITRVDLAGYQVRCGRGYSQPLPNRVPLKDLGHWRWANGEETYVPPAESEVVTAPAPVAPEVTGKT
jgi:hypothetical protein